MASDDILVIVQCRSLLLDFLVINTRTRMFPVFSFPMSKLRFKLGSSGAVEVEGPQATWPFDLQCIIRLPPDVAERIAPLVRHGNAAGLIQITPLSAEPRKFRVRVLDEVLEGKLYDLPTFVESFKAVGETIYKSADISQILIVYRPDAVHAVEPRWSTNEKHSKVPGAEYILTSGITPPTAYITRRRYRPETSKNDLSKAESAITSVIGGGVLEWAEELVVEEDEMNWRLQHDPSSVWEPDERVLEELIAAGELLENGMLKSEDEEE